MGCLKLAYWPEKTTFLKRVGDGTKHQKKRVRTYDYGARFYDPALGKWHSVDPSAEQRFSFSPYSFCSNNPIIRIDSDGALDDIVITGENNSSVTLETDLIDIEVDASSLGIDFGGNYSLAGEDVLSAGLDIVGIVDPTGVADGLNAGLQAQNGQWGGAIISGIGLVPYIGDLAKVGKVGKDVKTINKAIDAITSGGKKIDPSSGKVLGPSGKPAVHTINKSTKKEAKDAARNDRSNGAQGRAVKHTKDKKGGKHYHNGKGPNGKGKGTKDYGKDAGKVDNNVHYEYPE